VRGGGGAIPYDGEKAWSSINLSILSGGHSPDCAKGIKNRRRGSMMDSKKRIVSGGLGVKRKGEMGGSTSVCSVKQRDVQGLDY
jgi:hypothetical protein